VQYAINFPILNIHADDGRNDMTQNKRGVSKQQSEMASIYHWMEFFIKSILSVT
jgi:hypothetical protein